MTGVLAGWLAASVASGVILGRVIRHRDEHDE